MQQHRYEKWVMNRPNSHDDGSTFSIQLHQYKLKQGRQVDNYPIGIQYSILYDIHILARCFN